MRSKLGLSLIVVLLVVFGTSSLTLSNRNKSESGQDKKQPDLSHFPLVDYDVAAQSDPNKDARRQKKSKKYNSKHVPQINESTEIFHISDWDRGLPALPVSRSAAILIGEITEARAYLSENKTNIYSEFTIRVDEILKNDLKNPLTPGGLVAAEREGGRVRFASGKTVVATVNHQDMPRTGKKYVLFLMHFSLSAAEAEDFYLLTGYELREGSVFPLDKVLDGHPITRYKGTPAQAFLADLDAAIARGD